MSTAAGTWLEQRTNGAPDDLRARMLDAVAALPDGPAVYETLALAAAACLARSLPADADARALELLTADALLTHACESAAEAGAATLAEFTAEWRIERFEQLLSGASS